MRTLGVKTLTLHLSSFTPNSFLHSGHVFMVNVLQGEPASLTHGKAKMEENLSPGRYLQMPPYIVSHIVIFH